MEQDGNQNKVAKRRLGVQCSVLLGEVLNALSLCMGKAVSSEISEALEFSIARVEAVRTDVAILENAVQQGLVTEDQLAAMLADLLESWTWIQRHTAVYERTMPSEFPQSARRLFSSEEYRYIEPQQLLPIQAGQ